MWFSADAFEMCRPTRPIAATNSPSQSSGSETRGLTIGAPAPMRLAGKRRKIVG
jgi:hypothetical protein